MPNGARTKCGWGYFVRTVQKDEKEDETSDQSQNESEPVESSRRDVGDTEEPAPPQDDSSSSQENNLEQVMSNEQVAKPKVKQPRINSIKNDKQIQRMRNKWVAASAKDMNARLQKYFNAKKQ